MGTEKKTVVTSWYMVTSPFKNRAKDCCVITDTVVKKMAISALGHRAKHCMNSVTLLISC